uniref:triacylglycerol lipase n=1 Tax=Aceria tosichella TaxID=561515 RepID=A0A6G1SIN1_9ACAR
MLKHQKTSSTSAPLKHDEIKQRRKQQNRPPKVGIYPTKTTTTTKAPQPHAQLLKAQNSSNNNNKLQNTEQKAQHVHQELTTKTNAMFESPTSMSRQKADQNESSQNLLTGNNNTDNNYLGQGPINICNSSSKSIHKKCDKTSPSPLSPYYRQHYDNLHYDNKPPVVQQQQSKYSNSCADKAAVPTSKSNKDFNEVNLSFCGCGFLGIYHVGVASCFHEYAPQLSMHKISGSSAGALVAMSHICGNLQLAYCTTDFLAVAIEARSHTLGPFHPSFDIQASVREALERGLPEDAYLKANGKLHVSLTRVEDGENVIISEFKSNEDLIQVLLCSCFIPFWSGITLPKYKGVAYIDGGFSNNLITLDDKTVTVSPFAGEADICPQDDTLNLLQVNLSNTSFSLSPSNLYRLSHALLPPEPEVLSDLCKQGFADGIKFLQRMNLISCTKCLEIRSSLLVTTGGEDMEEVLSMNHTADSIDHNKTIPSDTSSLHHIILEQQEQKMIEISDRSRRSSFLSTKSQIYPNNQLQQQQQQQLQHNITSSLRNLLNVKTGETATAEEEDLRQQQPTHCSDCNLIRQKALYDPLPKQFSDRIRESCDKVNKSLSNWIYSHRPVKYLSYLMVPYYLPIDLTLAVIYNFWKKLPFIRAEIAENLYHVLDLVIVFLKRMQSRSTSAMLMGFDSSWQEDVIAYEKELIRKQQEKMEVHHHHHHHHHHRNSNTSLPASNASVAAATGVTGSCSSISAADSVSLASSRHRAGSNLSLSSTGLQPSIGQASQTRELHSLEDTFDSIVDVTSEQEGRIFAYYFRDSKDRLRVTEIFDLDHVHQPAIGHQPSSAPRSSVNGNGNGNGTNQPVVTAKQPTHQAPRSK